MQASAAAPESGSTPSEAISASAPPSARLGSLLLQDLSKAERVLRNLASEATRTLRNDSDLQCKVRKAFGEIYWRWRDAYVDLGEKRSRTCANAHTLSAAHPSAAPGSAFVGRLMRVAMPRQPIACAFEVRCDEPSLPTSGCRLLDEKEADEHEQQSTRFGYRSRQFERSDRRCDG